MNVVTEIWAVAERHSHRLAVRSARGDLTYGELRLASARVASAVRGQGVRPSDRVVLIAPTVSEFAVANIGLHAAGAGVITMNTMSTTAEIGYVLDDAAAALIVVWHECADAARAAAAERGLPILTLEDGAPFAAAEMAAPHQHDPDDTTLILYTSGTTGKPKGVELTAGNLLATVDAVREVMQISSEDRFGTALPLFHVFGQAVVMNTALTTGASLSLLSPFDPAELIHLTARDRLTVLAGVPTMWNAMLQAETNCGPDDFSDLRIAVSGGASLPVEVLNAFSRRFGCTILEGYGLTESTGAAAFNDITRPPRAGTVGPALPGTRVEVRDETGAPVPPGSAGEVFLSGPTIMKGYRNRPAATADDLSDGWLRTGDIGTLDEDGYLRIVDRVKDLIIRGGYNVYPREVEEVLFEHPDIVEVAVVGVPDEHFGEEIGAVVALRPGAELDADALRAWAKSKLSAYKVPRLFRFVDALPKGATGKILKRAIDRDSLRGTDSDLVRDRGH